MWLLQITENYANHRNYVLFGENVKFLQNVESRTPNYTWTAIISM